MVLPSPTAVNAKLAQAIDSVSMLGIRSRWGFGRAKNPSAGVPQRERKSSVRSGVARICGGLAGLAFLVAAPVRAPEFHVSPTGDDTNPGTVLRSNHITDVHRSAYAYGGAPNNGFFVDEGSNGFLLEANVVDRTSGHAVRFHQCQREWHT